MGYHLDAKDIIHRRDGLGEADELFEHLSEDYI
jgi:hypothetical protein